MQYTMVLNWRPTATRQEREAALMRRAQWQYPKGVEILGEYWLGTERPAVISHFETDDYGAVMEIQFTWGDVFEINVYPSVTPEEGLKIGPDAMARAQAYLA
jgi:hypothetical protein